MSHPRLSQKAAALQPSATMELSRQAARLKEQGAPVIALSAGEASFATPRAAAEAGHEAIEAGHTRYTSVDGIPALKAQIRARYQRDFGLDYTEDEVMATTGAKHALFNALTVLIDPGDEVVFQAPYWVSYPDMVRMCGGVPVVIDGRDSPGFRLQPEQLRHYLGPRTKALILNSPNNPTGVVYSPEELKALGAVLDSYPHVLVISDDIYDQIYWEQRPQPLPALLPHMGERTIIVNGVSKSYAMAGWRIGYALAPAEIIRAMRAFQSQSLSNPCSISQYAACEALKLGRDDLAGQVAAYQQRVTAVCKRLNTITGISAVVPDGAFYVFASIEQLLKRLGYQDDENFVLDLLRHQYVAVIHGSAFGCPGHMRLSCASDMAVLMQAMDRLEEFCAR